MEPYRTLYANASLPHTEFVAARVLTLPTGQGVTAELISGVCEIIRMVLDNASEVRKLLEERVLV